MSDQIESVTDRVSTISTMTLGELVAQSYQQAIDKGWTVHDVPVIEQVALILSEAAEALESWREMKPLSWTDSEGKPQGVVGSGITVGYLASTSSMRSRGNSRIMLPGHTDTVARGPEIYPLTSTIYLSSTIYRV